MKRQIIHIDETKCTGCGLCVPNCAEGSIEIRNGIAVLVRDALCDGLGACLGHCPEGALTIEERDAEGFDVELVEERLAALGREPHPAPPVAACPSAVPRILGGGCPSARPLELALPAATEATPGAATPSALGHWPVQLGLLPPTAPFFRGAELLLAADCAPFAYPNFHRDFLRGRALAVACPKLDDTGAHFKKLAEIFQQGGLASLTILRMEVPCCGGLTGMATAALRESGVNLPVREVILGRDGRVVADRPVGPGAA